MGGQIAGVLSPAIVGFLVSASDGSYDNAIYFLMSGAILCALTVLLLRRPRGAHGRGGLTAVLIRVDPVANSQRGQTNPSRPLA